MTSGIVYFDDGSGTTGVRNLVGTTNQIDIVNPDGVAGNPTFSISPNFSTGVPSVGFSAYVSANQTNVTGAGTAYTVIANTELYDLGSNYNNATGVFTAPTTGKYLFTAGISMTGLTLLTSNINITMVQAGSVARTYQVFNVSGISLAETGWGTNHSIIVRLVAGDTFKMVVTGSGQLTNGLTVAGNATNALTYFQCQELLLG